MSPLWEDPVRTYVEECLAGVDGMRQRSFNMRWLASMVAEVHRILLLGGVFLYSIDRTLRESGGKLRLTALRGQSDEFPDRTSKGHGQHWAGATSRDCARRTTSVGSGYLGIGVRGG